MARCDADWNKGQGTVDPSGSANDIVPIVIKGGYSVWITNGAAALRGALKDLASSFSVAAIDAERSPNPMESPALYRSWLHGVDDLIEIAANALAPSGKLFLELEPMDLLVHLEAAKRHGLHVEEALFWQKKYSGQNSRRLFEHRNDVILILSNGAERPGAELTFLPWRVAGKSEDGTREFNQLMEGKKKAPPYSAPDALKPSKLYQWLIDHRFPKDGDLKFLDLSSCGGSWTTLLRDRSSQLVDVFWAAGASFASSWWLLGKRLGNAGSLPQHQLATANLSPRSLIRCSCQWGLSHGPEPIDADDSVRLDIEDSAVGRPVGNVNGKTRHVISSIRMLARGRVLDLFGELQSLAPYGADLVDLLSADGLAALRLSESWPSDLLKLKDVCGPRPLIGLLVLYAEKEEVGPAAVLSLLSSRTPRFRLNPLWAAKSHKYDDPDQDPRGPWRDPKHKSARSGGPSTSFTCYSPPYRWSISSGSLPPGLWRLNPQTGVIWGVPEETGSWNLVVKVTDSTDVSVEGQISINVAASTASTSSEDELDVHSSPGWLFTALKPKGRLKFTPRSVTLQQGKRSAIVLEALGGRPFQREIKPPGKKVGQGRTRYWEFSKDSLLNAVLEDKAIFDESKPRIRKFKKDEKRSVVSMPSMMELADMDARHFFWERISRSSIGDLGLDFAPSGDDTCVTIRGISGAARASAAICKDCAVYAGLYDGCNVNHAVQLAAGLVLSSGQPGEPLQLIDIKANDMGLLFVDSPVVSETFLAMDSDSAKKTILAVRSSTKVAPFAKATKVSWPQ